jgi:hypothetical protein
LSVDNAREGQDGLSWVRLVLIVFLAGGQAVIGGWLLFTPMDARPAPPSIA